MCKLCNCNLEAKLSDLRKHKATNKHSDNAKLISQHRTLDSLAHVTGQQGEEIMLILEPKLTIIA